MLGLEMTWTEFYKGRLLSLEYQQYCQDKYWPFIHEIMRRMKPGDRVVEVGCGLATMTRILVDATERARSGFRCFDLSPEMVKYARINLHEGFPVDVGDARLPTNSKPDIVHSHGMLEHLSDEDIRSVIQSHRDDGARAAVHYVPGIKYAKPSFGDERLMTMELWSDIAAPTRIMPFNEDYDYALIWEF